MASCGFPAQGMACLLQFDCLMRISEVTSLTVGNVGFPGDARLAEETKQVLIRFPKTKTGSEQSVKIEDPAVAVLLQTLATEAKGASYRKLFASRLASPIAMSRIPAGMVELRACIAILYR